VLAELHQTVLMKDVLRKNIDRLFTCHSQMAGSGWALIIGESNGESERSLEDIWRGVKARYGLDVYNSESR